MSFGKFRGKWLDQVHRDKEMSADFCRVMYSISSYMRKNNLTPRPGNQTLADDSFVSERTVRRALDKAQSRGHLEIQAESRRSPRILIPLLKDDTESGLKVHTETVQNEHFQSGENPFETGLKVHTESGQQNPESGLECGQSFRSSPLESKRPEPISQESQKSQLKSTYGSYIYSEEVRVCDSREPFTKTLDAAHGRWREILPQFGIPHSALNGKEQPCPACGGRDRFLFDDRHGDGDYFCRRCDAGKGISLVKKVNGWTYAEAAKRVDEFIGNTVPAF
jgi:hypothetical protein